MQRHPAGRRGTLLEPELLLRRRAAPGCVSEEPVGRRWAPEATLIARAAASEEKTN